MAEVAQTMTGSAGTDAPAAATAGTTASSPTVDLPISGGSRSVRIRTFGGDRTAGVYEAWKDEVTTLMHIYGLQQKEMAPLVYFALEAGVGKPRDLVQHLDLVADIIQDKGVDTLIGTLDDEFEGKTYRRAEEASSAYYRTHRETGESMADYVSKLRVAKRTLELRDMGSTISNTSFAQRLLAKSGLPKPLRRQVLAAAGAAWDPAKITDALVLMYHDVHEEEAPRRRATGQANFKPSFSQHTTFSRQVNVTKGKVKARAALSQQIVRTTRRKKKRMTKKRVKKSRTSMRPIGPSTTAKNPMKTSSMLKAGAWQRLMRQDGVKLTAEASQKEKVSQAEGDRKKTGSLRRLSQARTLAWRSRV